LPKRKPKARKPEKQKSASNVKPSPPRNEEGAMIFSFKYLQLEHPEGKFCVEEKDGRYIVKFMTRLKDVSCLKASELRKSGGKSLRAHKIDWDETRVVFRILCHFVKLSKKEMTYDQNQFRHGCRFKAVA